MEESKPKEFEKEMPDERFQEQHSGLNFSVFLCWLAADSDIHFYSRDGRGKRENILLVQRQALPVY